MFTVALAMAATTPTIRAHSRPVNNAKAANTTMMPPTMCTQPQTV
jgi:hypothetical protein